MKVEEHIKKAAKWIKAEKSKKKAETGKTPENKPVAKPIQKEEVKRMQE